MGVLGVTQQVVFKLGGFGVVEQGVDFCWRGSEGKAKIIEKAQFIRINEHFEMIFNAAFATQVENQLPAMASPKSRMPRSSLLLIWLAALAMSSPRIT